MNIKTQKEIQITFNEPTLDIKAGIEISGDEDFFIRTLTKIVKNDMSRMIESVRNTMLEDNKQFYTAAHSLKGASSYAGCTRMHKISQSLQTCAEQKNYRLAVTLFNELVDEAKEVQKKYMEYAKSKGQYGRVWCR